MFSLTITEKGGAQRKLDFDKAEITIGRVQGNDIILPKGNVSKRHSRIVLKDGRFIVVDLKSTNGTYVNGRKITSPLVVKSGDKIYIGDFIITMDDAAGGAADDEPPTGAPQPAAAPPDRRPPPLRSSPPPPMAPSPKAPPPLPGRSGQVPAQADRFALDEDPSDESIPPQPRISPERGVPAAVREAPRSEPAPAPYAAPPPYAAPAPYAAPPASAPYGQQPPPPQQPAPYAQPAPYGQPQAPAPAPAYSQQQAPQQPAPYAAPPAAAPAPAPYAQQAAASAPTPAPAPAAPYVAPVARPPLSRVAPAPGMAGALRALMARIAQTFDVRNVDPRASGDEQRWRDAQRAIDGALASFGAELDASVDREALGSLALREATGLGALEALVADAGAREILVEGPTRVLLDAGRGLEPAAAVFSSADAVGIVARRFLAQGGIGVGASDTSVEARVGDWNATLLLPPLAPSGPLFVLRRADRRASSLVELAEQGVLGAAELEKLRAAIAQRRNVLVAGPLASGVTTLLSALLGVVDQRERIVTVEDVPGIVSEHGSIVALSTSGGARLSDVLRRASLLRPDRLVIDDLRGGEVYDALVVMAGRRSATIAGVHASSFEDALRHLEVLACLGGHVQPAAARSLLREAVQTVVVLGVEGGQRKVVAISDV